MDLSRRSCWLLFLCQFLTLPTSSESHSQSQVISAGSQIDTTHAIIITDQFSNSGRRSLFGFSLALISASAGAVDAAAGGWALIGAPASNTSDRDYKQRQIHEPGVIWRCSLGREPRENNTCRILFVDPLNPQIGKADCRPNACPVEKRDGSGLGFTLAVNAERFVTCAPRWQRQFGDSSAPAPVFKMNGICYWLPLQIALSEPFNIAPMISTGFRSQRLFPLLDKSMQIRENYPIWGWGQAGFTAHLTPTPGNELLLGAPGVNGWNGTVIKYQDDNDSNAFNASETPPTPFPEGVRLRSRPNANGKPEFAEFSLLQTDFVQFYLHLEYMGFAVTSGVYFQPERRLVAVSVPRGGRLRGLVLVLQFPDEETPYWYPAQVLQGAAVAAAAGGAGFGSYFGYTLESVDVSGDGLDELIVGAPWAQGHGCIYVYTATVNGRVTARQPRFGRPEPICKPELETGGETETGARFGAAIAGLGDLNGDGVNDFAVGAPGEGVDEGAETGAVYVYYGSKDEDLNTRPRRLAVRLTPETLGLAVPAPTGFGMSIYGNGVDVDGNGAPDFIIGAPLAQQVVLVRGRPRTDFEGHVDAYIEHAHGHGNTPNSNSDDADDSFIKVLPIHASQFIVRSCVRARGRNLKFTAAELNSVYEIQVTLNVDGELGRFTILAPVDSPGGAFEFERPGDGTVRYYAHVRSHIGGSHLDAECTEWIVHRVDHLGTNQNPRPVRIFQELHYKGHAQEHGTTPTPTPESYTIVRNARGVPELKLDETHADAVRPPAFCKFCPPTQRTLIDLSIPLAVDNCDADGVPTCAPRLSVGVRFEHSGDGTHSHSQPHSLVLGTAKELRAFIEVQNEAGAETAYFPWLELSWSPLQAALTPWNSDCELEREHRENRAQVLMRCDLGDRLQPNQTRTVVVSFPVVEYLARARNETLTLTAEVTAITEPDTGADARPEAKAGVEKKMSVSSSISLLSDTQLRLEGSIENASIARLTETDASVEAALTKIMHTYIVFLEGSAPVRSLHLSFWFPVRAADGDGRDLVLIGAPAAGNDRWGASACRIVTPNSNPTFYVDNSTTSTPKTRGIPRAPRPRPPYLVNTQGAGDGEGFAGEAEDGDEFEFEEVEEESDWVLHTHTHTRTQTTVHEYESARNSTLHSNSSHVRQSPMPTSTPPQLSPAAPSSSFVSLADDSRGFLHRTGVTYALRCAGAGVDVDKDDAHSSITPASSASNCLRVDCSFHAGGGGGVAPGRRILVRFPLFVRSGREARELFLNKTGPPTPTGAGRKNTAQADPSQRQRLRASGLSVPWRARPEPSPQQRQRPGKVLIQSLARAYMFDVAPEPVEDSDEDVRYASFVTLLAVRDANSDFDKFGYRTKVARLPLGWVYLLSAVVGLLLLGVLAYCLVKCGFFSRRRVPTTAAPQWKALRAEEKERETVG